MLLADLAKELPSWDGKLDAAVTLLDEQKTHIRRLTRALGGWAQVGACLGALLPCQQPPSTKPGRGFSS